jgi:hypothetical protein
VEVRPEQGKAVPNSTIRGMTVRMVWPSSSTSRLNSIWRAAARGLRRHFDGQGDLGGDLDAPGLHRGW